MKIRLLQYAYKLPFDRIGNLVNDIQEHGVLWNDDVGREEEVPPDDEKKIAEACDEVVLATKIRSDEDLYRKYEDQLDMDYYSYCPETFFVTVTDDGEYCPPKGKKNSAGKKAAETQPKTRESKDAKLISAYLLKYVLENHESFSAESPEDLMDGFRKYSTQKRPLKIALGLGDDEVSADSFSKNLQKICNTYFEFRNER